MAEVTVQKAFVQSGDPADPSSLPMKVDDAVAVPELPSEHHVLVRVLAVALNPIDHKNMTHFPCPGQGIGCDFCGVVVSWGQRVSDGSSLSLGDRVCGAVFPYSRRVDDGDRRCGAFAEWVVADARMLLRVPDQWTDLEGAALGGVGWATVALAMGDEQALGLAASPSRRDSNGVTVLVYGGATATGTMACQLLTLSGYTALAVTSPQSSSLALVYGAAGTASYTSPSCADALKRLAGNPIRHVLDCVTSRDSVGTCFAAMARTGGRYACVEALEEGWRTRRLIRCKEVMGYEALGKEARMGGVGEASTTYSREANPRLFGVATGWKGEVQRLLDEGRLRHHPVRELEGRWEESIPLGLGMLRRGEVRGEKLAVRVASLDG